MAHTKRTRTSPDPATHHAASTERTAAAAGRGGTLALFATLALSLATAIAAAAWLISTQEFTGMTAPTMPDTRATVANDAAPVTPAAPTTAAANASLTATATATANANTTVPADAVNDPQATTQQPSAPSPPSAAGQRAFIDPVTGQLRQPEHDEIAAIAAAAAAAAPARRSAARTANAAAEFFGPDGSIAAVVPEDLHTFTVATRGPDGRIVIEHAQGAKEAVKVMKANSAKKGPQAPVSRTQQKEDRDDR